MERRNLLKFAGVGSLAPLLGSTVLSSVHAEMGSELNGLRQYMKRIDQIAKTYSYNYPEIRPLFDRHALLLLSLAYIQIFGTSSEHPQWIPYIPFYLPWGIPNPDDVYKNVPIDPEGIYHIYGNKNSPTIAKITLKRGGAHLGEVSSGKTLNEIDLTEIEADIYGNYGFILSAQKPKDSSLRWIKLHSECTKLMYRSVTKTMEERDPSVYIERLNYKHGIDFLKPSQLQLKKYNLYEFAIKQLEFLINLKIERQNLGSDEKFIFDNDQIKYGGLLGQKYLFHTFSLEEDEALILESEVPKQVKYWNVMLFDEFIDGIDAVYHQSSLNDMQAKHGKDSKVRFVVSHRDPQVYNWLDTGGWPTGGIMWRWNNASEYPVPSVRKVKFKDIFHYLPKDTEKLSIELRRELISKRIAHYQQRLH